MTACRAIWKEMIKRQIEHLAVDERCLLEVASAAGAEFSALLVARGAGPSRGGCRADVRGPGTDRSHYRRGRHDRVAELRVSGRYAFQHALYQEILYQRLAPARRMKTHRCLGQGLERGYGRRLWRSPPLSRAISNWAAISRKAMHYLGAAAEGSARRFSTREAASYLSRALELVPICRRSFRSRHV